MQTFRKYEVAPKTWETLKKEIQIETTSPDGQSVVSWNNEIVSVVVELGQLCAEYGIDKEGNPICLKQNAKESIDIVWVGEASSKFAEYLVWPNPVGISSMGYTLDNEYAQAFCLANPQAEYCKPPTTSPIK